jgi:hypothetical protein
MKDYGNPLTAALKFKKAIGAPSSGLFPARTQHVVASTQEGTMGMLSFHKSNVPNLGNSKTGDKITVTVHGAVHSVDPNGNMKMKVNGFPKPDSQAMDKKQYPDVASRPAGVDRSH